MTAIDRRLAGPRIGGSSAFLRYDYLRARRDFYGLRDEELDRLLNQRRTVLLGRA